MGAGAAPLRPASGPAGGAGPRRGGRAASPAVPSARNRGAGGCEAGGRTGRRERAAGPLGLAPGARAASAGSSRAGAGGALPRRGKPGTGRAPGRRGATETMTTGSVLPLLLLGLSGALRVSCRLPARGRSRNAWGWLGYPGSLIPPPALHEAARDRSRELRGGAGGTRDAISLPDLRSGAALFGVALASIARQQRILSSSRLPGSGPLRGALARVSWVPRSAAEVGGGGDYGARAVAVVSGESSRLREGPERGRGGSAKH